jgi:formate-dependent nitrite reductase membrane component NrfD
MLVLAGPYTGAFFGLVVLAGILAPLLIESRELGRPIQRALAAPLLVLSGGFALRAVLVAAGQVSSYSMLGG